jgi:HK97 gp10 family phage protein
MAAIEIDLMKYFPEFEKAAMDRIEKAAGVIRDAARRNCTVGTISRPAKGKFWTERSPGAMRDTIRVATKEGAKNVFLIAGDKKTWWATQMEYGRGGWKGGAKPFIRPAIASTKDEVKSIIEGG